MSIPSASEGNRAHERYGEQLHDIGRGGAAPVNQRMERGRGIVLTDEEKMHFVLNILFGCIPFLCCSLPCFCCYTEEMRRNDCRMYCCIEWPPNQQ
mmetsp:Transcript_394/g.561  ORF Transcript_394/g.561 Transcript_394/m.561 type:complete len:96 (-) Transcript_394:285-572(-)